MKLNKSQLLALQAIHQKGLPVEKSASLWLARFVAEEGIGQVIGRKVVLSYDDMQKIGTFLSVNGYSQPLTADDFSDRMTMSRVHGDEKLARSPVTQDRVLVKSLTQSFQVNGKRFPAGHGIEFRVSELLQAKPSQVLLVENLAAFLTIQDYSAVSDCLLSDVLVIYRGGPGFSAQASQRYLAECQAQVIGFLDFDAASLCQLGVKNLDGLLLPSIEQAQLPALLSASKEGLFADHLAQYGAQLNQLIQKGESLKPWAELLCNNQLAVMQEAILSRGFPLLVVPLVNTKVHETRR
jgi:hypothetical protein